MSIIRQCTLASPFNVDFLNFVKNFRPRFFVTGSSKYDIMGITLYSTSFINEPAFFEYTDNIDHIVLMFVLENFGIQKINISNPRVTHSVSNSTVYSDTHKLVFKYVDQNIILSIFEKRIGTNYFDLVNSLFLRPAKIPMGFQS